MDTEFAITIDTDWAPDFMVSFAADLLIQRQVKATWFITHTSPAIDRLRQYPSLFELGIHPNFLPGSSHGETAEAVLRHCLNLAPEAKSLRTHALVQSTPLLRTIMNETSIVTDVSLLLPHMPHIRPVKFSVDGRTLLRVPYFWEDSLEIEQEHPVWDITELSEVGKGLKIINFHPVHIYLNSSMSSGYCELKLKCAGLMDLTAEMSAECVQDGEGTQTLFRQLLDHLANKNSWCIRDIYSNNSSVKASPLAKGVDV